jgi:hypothetical protein
MILHVCIGMSVGGMLGMCFCPAMGPALAIIGGIAACQYR